MRITPDTNVLVRAATKDEPRQGEQAKQRLGDAELIAVTLPALCEFVWVLQRGRKLPAGWIADAVRALVGSPRVQINRQAVAAGLALLEAGGDFADGVIAFEGRRMGGETFVTFDRKAATLLKQRGDNVQLLGAAG